MLICVDVDKYFSAQFIFIPSRVHQIMMGIHFRKSTYLPIHTAAWTGRTDTNIFLFFCFSFGSFSIHAILKLNKWPITNKMNDWNWAIPWLRCDWCVSSVKKRYNDDGNGGGRDGSESGWFRRGRGWLQNTQLLIDVHHNDTCVACIHNTFYTEFKPTYNTKCRSI